jgi:hypothetical protein
MSASPEEISAEVFASLTRQDSGCHSYGVTVEGCRLFVKASAEDRAIASLERAVNNPRVNNDEFAEEMVRMLIRVRRHLPRKR